MTLPETRRDTPTSSATYSAPLVVSDLVKTFGETTAVDHLTLTAQPASVLALLGPNGAGKTTTIEICEGFTSPTSGTVNVLGLDPTRDGDQLRRRIGIMLQGGGAYPGIRVKEMLTLIGGYFANPLDADWLIELVGLGNVARTSYRRLSGGQQQRLSLACALIGRPELVFLDEPTAGMDAQSRLAVWELISSLRRDGATIVLTTHLMDEAESLADNVIIIDKGRKVAEGTPAQLTTHGDSPGSANIRIDCTSSIDTRRFDTALRAAGIDPSVQITATRPLSYRVTAPPSPQLVAAITAASAEQNVLIRDLSIDHRSLEDVFLDITGRHMRS